MPLRAESEIDFIVEVRKRTTTKPASVIAIEVNAAKRWNRKWERPCRDLSAGGKVDVAAMYGVYLGAEVLEFDGLVVLQVTEFLARLAAGEIF